MRVGRDTNAAWRVWVALTLALITTLVGFIAPASAMTASSSAPAGAHELIDPGAGSVGGSDAPPVSMASLDGFDPSNIISDATFYDASRMSASQIQSFLDFRGSGCNSSGSLTCLKDYQQRTYSFAGDRYCSGYTSGGVEGAAAMIWKSAIACGINPQVLLVTLQKEQSLITAARTPATYQRAMGFGCPDNVGGVCDPSYAGFHVQVYYAARQLLRYADTSLFTSYPVGQISNIRYHPNASCGSSPVRIANQATRSLYIYTPYQPNAAAMRAGWGTGDGCSAYGNRNFYNYFTDWFGSTQSSWRVGQFVQLSGDARVYLPTSDGRLLHLPNWETASALGLARSVLKVPASAMAGYQRVGSLSMFGRCGGINFVAGNGVLNPVTPAAIAGFAPVQLDRDTCALLRRPAVAQATTILLNPSNEGRIYYAGQGDVRLVINPEALRTLVAGGRSPIIKVDAGLFSTLPKAGSIDPAGAAFATPGRFVSVAGEGRIYLPTGDGRLLYLPNWQLADNLGLYRGVVTVTESQVAGFTRAGSLSAFVTCGGSPFVASGGVLHPVSTPAVEGVGLLALDERLCSIVPRSSKVIEQLFIQGSSSSRVHLVDNGEVRHIVTSSALRIISDGAATVLPVGDAALNSLPRGSAIGDVEAVTMVPGRFVSITGDSRVYLPTSDGRLLYLNSWSVADEFGLPRDVAQIAQGAGAAFRMDGALSPFVRCGGRAYAPAQGVFRAVTDGALSGFVASTLDDRICAVLRLDGAAPLDQLFLASPATSRTYFVEGARLRHVVTVDKLRELLAGRPLTVLRIGDGLMATLPKGEPVG